MSSRNVICNSHEGLVLQCCYKTIINTIEARYDVRGSLLAELVRSSLENRARASASLRQYCSSYVQEEALSYIDRVTERLLFGPNGRFSAAEYGYKSSVPCV